MPSKAIGTSLDYGFPGEFSRNGDCVIKSRFVRLTDLTGPKFGDPVVLIPDTQGGTWSSIAAFIAGGGTYSASRGFAVAVRNVKQFSNYDQQNGILGYLPGQPADALERGSVSVVCNVGTPAAGGQVFVRTVLNGAIPAGVVGGFEAAADGSNTVALIGCVFHTGLKDENNITEITLLERFIA